MYKSRAINFKSVFPLYTLYINSNLVRKGGSTSIFMLQATKFMEENFCIS